VHPPLTPQQAKNIVNYLRTIHRILTPGGVWINCGPLLWHFENSEEISIEVSLEEVKSLAMEIGFVIEVRLLVSVLSASHLQIQGQC
jgi:carnosine N-methyltransferase